MDERLSGNMTHTTRSAACFCAWLKPHSGALRLLEASSMTLTTSSSVLILLWSCTKQRMHFGNLKKDLPLCHCIVVIQNNFAHCNLSSRLCSMQNLALLVEEESIAPRDCLSVHRLWHSVCKCSLELSFSSLDSLDESLPDELSFSIGPCSWTWSPPPK